MKALCTVALFLLASVLSCGDPPSCPPADAGLPACEAVSECDETGAPAATYSMCFVDPKTQTTPATACGRRCSDTCVLARGPAHGCATAAGVLCVRDCATCGGTSVPAL